MTSIRQTDKDTFSFVSLVVCFGAGMINYYADIPVSGALETRVRNLVPGNASSKCGCFPVPLALFVVVCRALPLVWSPSPVHFNIYKYFSEVFYHHLRPWHWQSAHT